MNSWLKTDYANIAHVRERYEADKLLEECKASLDQLKMAEKGFKEEKATGLKLWMATKEKIKAVSYSLLLAPEKET